MPLAHHLEATPACLPYQFSLSSAGDVRTKQQSFHGRLVGYTNVNFDRVAH